MDFLISRSFIIAHLFLGYFLRRLCSDAACVCLCTPKALKVLRTSEFLPYVVFIEAPDFEVLKAMNRSAIESGVITKQLTVSWNQAMDCFSITQTGLTLCFLKCSPQDSELKRTVDESERIKRAYGHYFDLCIVNDGLEAAFRSLRSALEKLLTEQQWVPVSWVF